MCLYPRIINNKKYQSNKKNGGVIPPLSDQRIKKVPVGCGNCIECRKQISRNWQVRIQEEIKTAKNGKFTTLTFSDQSIYELTKIIQKKTTWNIQGYQLDNAIATLAVRRFNERYRKKYKKALRHWLVTELGHNGTENIHLHGIIWTDKTMNEIEQIWNYGHIWKGKGPQQINYVNNKTVNYTIGYITKIDETHKYYKPIILTSPGMGANYIKSFNATRNKFNGKETQESYRTESGHKINLPTYYRNKIYTEQQREQLWIQKIDKDERWVCGVKIKNASTEQGNKEYWSVLERHRQRNIQLGYGNDEKDWDREQYENELRTIKQQTRIAKAIQKGKYK